MIRVPQPVKLEELREKTDRQLNTLVRSKLKLARDLARHGVDGDSYERAEKAYAEASLLLPAICRISTAERRSLEIMLAEAGKTLARASSTRKPLVRTAGQPA